MAKTAGPLMSLDASGSVAGTITFSKWKGRNYVRQLVTPANPNTVKQISVRSMMKFLSQEWAGLTPTEQGTWDDLAAAGQYSPFNAYVSKNQSRWANFLPPSKEYPALEGDLAAVLGVTTVTNGVGQLTLSQAITTANQNWSLLIFRSLVTGFTPSFSNLVAVVNGEGAGPITYVDTPLDPDTYFYRVRGGSVEGKLGAAAAEASGVVS